MRSEVGIDPKSLCYGFYGPSMLKWGYWNPSDRMYQFNEGCTKFCEGCTKGLKMHSEVGIDPQSLSYGFL